MITNDIITINITDLIIGDDYRVTVRLQNTSNYYCELDRYTVEFNANNISKSILFYLKKSSDLNIILLEVETVNLINGNKKLENSIWLCPTPTPTITPSITPTNSVTPTPTSTLGPSQTPTKSPTPTITPTESPTATVTPSFSPTATATCSVGAPATPTPTSTTTATTTPVSTSTPTRTPTRTLNSTPTLTASETPTTTPTPTSTSILNYCWTQSGNDLYPILTGQNDDLRSGWDVDANGDGTIVAVSTPGFQGTDIGGVIRNALGLVQIYQWNSTNNSWTSIGSIRGKYGLDGVESINIKLNRVGNVMALGFSNSTLGVGGANPYGCVRIYNRSGNSWIQKGSDIRGSNQGSYLGSNISLSDDGNVIAISSTGSSTLSVAPKVTVYSWNGSSWTAKGKAFGDNTLDVGNGVIGSYIKLSKDGNKISIYDDGILTTGISVPGGKISTYEWNNSSWVLKSEVVGQALQDFGGRGADVDISDDHSVLVLSSREDINMPGGLFINMTYRAAIRTYDWNSNTSSWILRNTITNTTNRGRFKLNNNGNILSTTVVAQTQPSTIRKIINYQWKNNAWIQLGNEINADTEQNAGFLDSPPTFFFSSELDGTGNLLIVGAPYKNIPGYIDAGLARIYRLAPCTTPTPTPTQTASKRPTPTRTYSPTPTPTPSPSPDDCILFCSPSDIASRYNLSPVAGYASIRNDSITVNYIAQLEQSRGYSIEFIYNSASCGPYDGLTTYPTSSTNYHWFWNSTKSSWEIINSTLGTNWIGTMKLCKIPSFDL